MRRPVKISVGLLVLCILGCSIVLFMASSNVQSQSTSNTDDPFYIINQKALTAKSNDETAVRDLAREIFKQFALPEVSQPVRDEMVERLVRAEIAFRNEGRNSLTEDDVVRTMNWITDQFNAPSYAKTDNNQINYLRYVLAQVMPDLVAQEEFGASKTFGSKIGGKMSPLEATAMSLLMLCQKMGNSEYMVTSDEFATKLTQDSYGQTDAVARIEARDADSKQAEMEQSLYNSNANLADFHNRALDVLGVER